MAATAPAEFEKRLNGVSYAEIAKAGGGILSTVRGNARGERGRSCSPPPLRRLDNLLAEGVTTVEIKSGYGLDVETEMKMLQSGARTRQAPAGRSHDDLPRRPRLSAGVSRTTVPAM